MSRNWRTYDEWLAALGGEHTEARSNAFKAGWIAAHNSHGVPFEGPTSEQIDLARFILSEDCRDEGRNLTERAAEILFAALGGEGDVDD